MKTFISRVKDKLSVTIADARATVTVFLQTEPVRARALVLSALVAAGTVIPALASSRVDELVAGIVGTVLTVGVGEAARSKVSPTGK
jgi:uncharacterized membrane protein